MSEQLKKFDFSREKFTREENILQKMLKESSTMNKVSELELFFPNEQESFSSNVSNSFLQRVENEMVDENDELFSFEEIFRKNNKPMQKLEECEEKGKETCSIAHENLDNSRNAISEEDNFEMKIEEMENQKYLVKLEMEENGLIYQMPNGETIELEDVEMTIKIETEGFI